jgi:hypothetical protein
MANVNGKFIDNDARWLLEQAEASTVDVNYDSAGLLSGVNEIVNGTARQTSIVRSGGKIVQVITTCGGLTKTVNITRSGSRITNVSSTIN